MADPANQQTVPTPVPVDVTPAPAVETPPVPPIEAAPLADSDPKGGIVTLPSSAMRRIKEEERARGKRLATQEADTRAKALGFADSAELERVAAATKQPPPVVTPEPPAPQVPPVVLDDVAQLRAEVAQLAAKNRQLAKKTVGADRETRRLQQELDAAEATSTLKLAAAKAGVLDVEYALHMLKKHVTTLPGDSVAAFDEGKFFRETLRGSHPALYAVQDRPAHTGHNEPALPKPAPIVKTPEGTDPVKDVRVLSRAEYDARLRAHGLTNPASGVPG